MDFVLDLAYAERNRKKKKERKCQITFEMKALCDDKTKENLWHISFILIILIIFVRDMIRVKPGLKYI